MRYLAQCVLECARASKQAVRPHIRDLAAYLNHAVDTNAPLVRSPTPTPHLTPRGLELVQP